MLSLSTRKVSVLCLLINYPHLTHSPLLSPPAACGAPKAKSAAKPRAAKPATKPVAKRTARPLAIRHGPSRFGEPKSDPSKDKRVKIGMKVHIPASAFPKEKPPSCMYWVGKVVKTLAGGKDDAGIYVDGEEVFTRSKAEVAGWLV